MTQFATFRKDRSQMVELTADAIEVLLNCFDDPDIQCPVSRWLKAVYKREQKILLDINLYPALDIHMLYRQIA